MTRSGLPRGGGGGVNALDHGKVASRPRAWRGSSLLYRFICGAISKINCLTDSTVSLSHVTQDVVFVNQLKVNNDNMRFYFLENGWPKSRDPIPYDDQRSYFCKIIKIE